MAKKSDFVLIGTGLAPLVAAARLLSEGKTVTLLNPDFDFFTENSELPLDPFFYTAATPFKSARLKNSVPETALPSLRLDFPGSVEFASDSFRDPSAPFLRSRARLWNHSFFGVPKESGVPWERLEEVFVEASDLGMNPQILEGILAERRFPGSSKKMTAETNRVQGLFVPKLVDLDVSRYRQGFLEFLRERLGPEGLRMAVSDIEPTVEGLRYRWGGLAHTLAVNEAVLVFWTPKLSPWIMGLMRRGEKRIPAEKFPAGIRIWEEWTLLSRDPVDPGVVGVFEDAVVWADLEGSQKESDRLVVLKPGPRIPLKDPTNEAFVGSAASQDSFRFLSRISAQALKWDWFCIRSMRARSLMEWNWDWKTDAPIPLAKAGEFEHFYAFGASDGSVFDVIESARAACAVGMKAVGT